MQQVERSRQETNTILDYKTLKDTADSLDFSSPSRRTRDGEKDIKIHSRKEPDEYLKLLIFEMANRVTIHSNLQSKFRKKVLALCAKVLFYDHGYKKVQGVSNLDSTWGARLIADAYETGSNPRPLRSRGKGSVSIVDKVEMLERGLVRKHFRYAEKTIGNQASFDHLART